MKKKGIITGLGIILLFFVIVFYTFNSWHQRKQALTLYGNVDIRDVNLAFRVGGRLSELRVDEGDTVHRGELIARLDPEPYVREVVAAKSAINQQKAALVYAETVFAREKKLYGTGASSIDQYQNALFSRDAAKANLEKAMADLSLFQLHVQDTSLYAPADGAVLTRAVEPGTMLAAGASVITVSLLNPVWVRAYIAETDLGQAKQGTHVQVFSDSKPNDPLDGVIGFVSSTAEFTPKTVETPDLRTQLVYRLRIIIHDPKHELRQGMPVTVRFLP